MLEVPYIDHRHQTENPSLKFSRKVRQNVTQFHYWKGLAALHSSDSRCDSYPEAFASVGSTYPNFAACKFCIASTITFSGTAPIARKA